MKTADKRKTLITKKQVIGKKHFRGTVDATDPCYNHDVWCRMNGIPVCDGEYDCVIWKTQERNEPSRVARIGIYLRGIVPAQKKMERIGEIGVDAGLAGFFMNKPDYSDEEWIAVCDRISKGDAWILPEGFFSSSGYGDGGYDVYAYKQPDGRAGALEIVFL